MRFTITENGDTQTFVIPIGGLLLIDPQGVVYDRVAYDQAIAAGRTPEEARAQAAITGATVRLQRRNPDGGFANVLSGDPGITPNINPQVTRRQRPVPVGCPPPACYRVSVEAPGFVARVSREVTIPPPVLDLHVAMERVAAPRPRPGSPLRRHRLRHPPRPRRFHAGADPAGRPAVGLPAGARRAGLARRNTVTSARCAARPRRRAAGREGGRCVRPCAAPAGCAMPARARDAHVPPVARPGDEADRDAHEGGRNAPACAPPRGGRCAPPSPAPASARAWWCSR